MIIFYNREPCRWLLPFYYHRLRKWASRVLIISHKCPAALKHF